MADVDRKATSLWPSPVLLCLAMGILLVALVAGIVRGPVPAAEVSFVPVPAAESSQP